MDQTSKSPLQAAFEYQARAVVPQLNAGAAHEAKLQGQDAALTFSGEWGKDVIAELRFWLQRRKKAGHTEVLMEQFRAEAVCQPLTPKAWGALPSKAKLAGLIEPRRHADGSPVMRKTEAVKTHRHPVRVWSIV